MDLFWKLIGVVIGFFSEFYDDNNNGDSNKNPDSGRHVPRKPHDAVDLFRVLANWVSWVYSPCSARRHDGRQQNERCVPENSGCIEHTLFHWVMGNLF